VLLLAGAGAGMVEENAAETESAGKTPKPASEAEEASAPPAEESQDSAEGEQVALAPGLWLDPDVRWLTGVHEAEGHFYLVREEYEELLWWLLLPALLRVAGEAAPARTEVMRMAATIGEALKTAEEAGYRVDVLLGPVLAGQAAGIEEQVDEAAEDEGEVLPAARDDGGGTAS